MPRASMICPILRSRGNHPPSLPVQHASSVTQVDAPHTTSPEPGTSPTSFLESLGASFGASVLVSAPESFPVSAPASVPVSKVLLSLATSALPSPGEVPSAVPSINVPSAPASVGVPGTAGVPGSPGGKQTRGGTHAAESVMVALTQRPLLAQVELGSQTTPMHRSYITMGRNSVSPSM